MTLDEDLRWLKDSEPDTPVEPILEAVWRSINAIRRRRRFRRRAIRVAAWGILLLSVAGIWRLARRGRRS